MAASEASAAADADEDDDWSAASFRLLPPASSLDGESDLLASCKFCNCATKSPGTGEADGSGACCCCCCNKPRAVVAADGVEPAAAVAEVAAGVTGGGLSARCRAATREGAGAGGEDERVEDELAPPAAECGRRKSGSLGAGASRSEGRSEGEPALEPLEPSPTLGAPPEPAATICSRSASSRAGLPLRSCCSA